MKRLSAFAAVLLIAACSSMPSWVPGSGWTTLIDGDKGLENFERVGDANWRAEGGAIVADKAPNAGFLLTRNSYKDFQIRAEFWADHGTNSGIYIRIQDPKKIGSVSAYEVNIYDQRPGPEYGTAAIVDVAKVPVPSPYKAGGKWNTFLITAKGSNLVVEFNGQKTVDIQDGKFAQGPLALQFANHGKAPGAPIRWRKLEVRSL
jgi:hypothetical protein